MHNAFYVDFSGEFMLMDSARSFVTPFNSMHSVESNNNKKNMNFNNNNERKKNRHTNTHTKCYAYRNHKHRHIITI